jgi:hypothetical protein
MPGITCSICIQLHLWGICICGLDAEDGGQQLPVPQALQQEAAEVVAGALGVQQEQVGMMWMWGSQKLPQDTDYRYLGVQLTQY